MADRAFVLIVDEDPDSGKGLSHGLADSGHACKIVGSGREAIDSVRQRPPDVVLTGYQLGNGVTGIDVLRAAKRESAETEVILVSSPADADRVRESLGANGSARAFDCLVEPVDASMIRRRIDAAAEQAHDARRKRMLDEQRAKAFNFEGLIGTSDVLARELKRVAKLAPTKSTVLIFGESGTGKELVAQGVHRLSPRSGKAFMPINCPSLSETLLESELFGHVKGAYTGAMADRKGLLETADGGTVFLDEIGDMPLPMQAKVLRVIETGEVVRVGSNEIRRVDVRFVAATHRDLWQLVEEGKFREDLLYRLHAHGAIRIPPLRNRREDIPLLVQHFLELANREFDRNVQRVTPEALRKMTNHGWRGNVRELKSVIERMVLEAESDELDVQHLPEHIRGSTDLVPAGMPSLAGLSMADVERLHILNTLKLTGGNRERTANILKIGARTLYRKLKDYGIT